MPALGTLSIGTRRFDVYDATLSAAVVAEGAVVWDLEVKGRDRRGERTGWEPRAYIQQYASSARSFAQFFAAPWSIPNGRDFAGGTMLPGRPLCALYVVEHDFLDDTSVRFAPARGRFLRVEWSSTCSVPPYGDVAGVPLRIETRVELLGFAVPVRSQRAAEKLMAATFDTGGLRYHREGGESFFIPSG